MTKSEQSAKLLLQCYPCWQYNCKKQCEAFQYRILDCPARITDPRQYLRLLEAIIEYDPDVNNTIQLRQRVHKIRKQIKRGKLTPR